MQSLFKVQVSQRNRGINSHYVAISGLRLVDSSLLSYPYVKVAVIILHDIAFTVQYFETLPNKYYVIANTVQYL